MRYLFDRIEIIVKYSPGNKLFLMKSESFIKELISRWWKVKICLFFGVKKYRLSLKWIMIL